MKKLLITAAFALSAAFGYSQNSNPWPTTGNVGIGTSSPNVRLDVVKNFSALITGTQKSELGSFSSSTSSTRPESEIQFNINNYFNSWDGFLYTKLQSTLTSTDKAFIQFGHASGTPMVSGDKTALGFGFNTSTFMTIQENGEVRIGSVNTPTGYKLYVEDGIITEKVKVAVKTTGDWADYVFAADYELMPLEEVEAYTREYGHLPNVPSAEEMVANGLDVAQMDAKLLEKVEELTLYLIEQQKQIEALKAEIATLKEQKQ